MGGPRHSGGSAKSSSVLRTKIPVVRTAPVSVGRRSTSSTSWPRRASSVAVCSPASPAPTTRTSAVSRTATPLPAAPGGAHGQRDRPDDEDHADALEAGGVVGLAEDDGGDAEGDDQHREHVRHGVSLEAYGVRS